MSLAMPTSRQASRGVTLIEVLVALVVLSIGLLGVCALIIDSVRSNDSADMRSKAAILANAIVDDMRANSAAAVAGQYDVGYGAAASGTSVASQDLANWKNALSASYSVNGISNQSSGLPSGDGKITHATVANPNATFTQVTVTVQWDDSRAGFAFGGVATPSACTKSGSVCLATLTVNAYIP
jgi:type IV pilus assembly protein PilV